MISFRPHILQYASAQSNDQRDENGFLITSESEFVGEIPCLLKPSGANRLKTFEDGRVFNIYGTVRLDVDCREFAVGETVRVSHNGKVIAERDVLGFQRGQFGARIWI